MNKIVKALIIASIPIAMVAQQTTIDIPITVTDGVSNQELHLGLNPNATDGIDGTLGEAELPPVPPSGVFDARCIGDDISISALGQGTWRDYRKADGTSVSVHEIRYQVGTGTSITISWNMPQGVSGRLQDIILGTIVDVAMSGTGNTTISNPGGIPKVKLTITYVSVIDIPITVTDGVSNQELHLGLNPNATDGIDGTLGEAELPPVPPSGVFDARCIGDDISISALGQGTWRDYRKADGTSVSVHEIRYQVGTGTSITISWNMPQGVSGRLQDIILGTIVDVAMSGTGNTTISNPGGIPKVKITLQYSPVIVEENGQIPFNISLDQNYPNPFNPATTIRFTLRNDAYVSLSIYSMTGVEVERLFNGKRGVGNHSVVWNAGGFPSGVYFCRLQVGTNILSRKLVLMK